MTDIIAVVVGIEKYDFPTWNVSGPCRSAISITQHLIEIGTEPGNIFLYTNEHWSDTEPSPASIELESLRQKGVRLGEPTEQAIDTCFSTLDADRPANSRLFFYWSGHGFNNKDRDYILICSDYAGRAFRNRIFNASHRLLRLSSTQFKSFSEQLFFADVCAKDASIEFGTDRTPIDHLNHDGRQLAFFATRDGAYSRGEFSTVLLQVLKEVSDWPDIDLFSTKLWQALKDSKIEPLMVASMGGGKHLRQSVGQPRGSTLIHDAFSLLSTIALPLSRFGECYILTTRNLYGSEKPCPSSLWEMVLDLGRQRDGSEDRISYGLLQFLVRVSQGEEAGHPIVDWLKQIGRPEQQQQLTDINNVLAAEQERKVLVVELDNDAAGSPTRFTWFVCSRSKSALISSAPSPVDVQTWSDFGTKLSNVLDNVEAGSNLIAEVHFVVEPPLFDCDFQLIKRHPHDPESPGLGELHIVLLRHRTRLYQSSSTPLRRALERRATALRGISGAEIRRIRIPADATNLSRLLEGGDGLCYAGFLFGRPTDALRNERQTLNRLVALMGIPYLYWLQKAPPGDWAEDLDEQLRLWLCKCVNLSDFPGAIQERRAGGEHLALHGSILWDEPHFFPFNRKISPTRD